MKYRIVENLMYVDDPMTGLPLAPIHNYEVQVKGFIFWHTVKKFNHSDKSYALRCAEELYDKLIEKI